MLQNEKYERLDVLRNALEYAAKRKGGRIQTTVGDRVSVRDISLEASNTKIVPLN